MATNLSVKVSLDVNASAQLIEDDIKKLQNIIDNNNKIRLKIVAGLNIKESNRLINAQLQNLQTNLNSQNLTITPTLDTSKIQTQVQNISNQISEASKVSSITTDTSTSQALTQTSNELSKVAQSANSVNEAMSTLSNNNYNYMLKGMAVDVSSVTTQFSDLETVLRDAETSFKSIEGVESASANWFSAPNGAIKGFIVNVNTAIGTMEKFRYTFVQSDLGNNYVLDNITGSDNGVQKLTEAISKTKAEYTKKINEFKSTYQSILPAFNDQLTQLEERLQNLSSATDINNLKNAFNELKASALNISQYLQPQDSSFNKVTNAVNNYKNLDNVLNELKSTFQNLSIQEEQQATDLANLETHIRELQTLGGENGEGVGTLEWAKKYQEVNAELKQVKTNIEAAKKAEQESSKNDANNKYARQQALLKEIMDAWKEINRLTKLSESAVGENKEKLQNEIWILRLIADQSKAILQEEGLITAEIQNQIEKEEAKYNWAQKYSAEQKKVRSDEETRNRYLSQIKKNYDLIIKCEKQLLNAGEEESKVLEHQIEKAEKRLNYETQQLAKKQLLTAEAQKYINTLVDELDYVKEINQAKQNDKINKTVSEEQKTAELERQAKYVDKINQYYKESIKLNSKVLDVNSQEYKIREQVLKNNQKNIKYQIEQLKKYGLMTNEISLMVAAYERQLEIQNKIKAAQSSDNTKLTIQETIDKYKELYTYIKQMYSDQWQSTQFADQFTAMDNALKNLEKTKSGQAIKEVEKAFVSLSTALKDTEKLTTEVSQKINAISSNMGNSLYVGNKDNPAVQNLISQLDALKQKYKEIQNQLANGTLDNATITKLKSDINKLNSEYQKLGETQNTLKQTLRADNSFNIQSARVQTLIAQILKWRQANTAAELQYGKDMDAMLEKLKNFGNGSQAQFKKINNEWKTLKATMQQAGATGLTVMDSLKQKLVKFSSWLGVSMITATIAREIRQLFTTVLELDTALVDLKKTFKGTSDELQDLYNESNNIAKQLGVTTKEVIEMSASFSRLGYNTKETASEMAKMASMFKLISPGMTIDQSTDGIISMAKAFKIEAKDIQKEILDVVNATGNAFALNNTDIVEAMTRSSAAMAVANNSLKETIALNTAAKILG